MPLPSALQEGSRPAPLQLRSLAASLALRRASSQFQPNASLRLRRSLLGSVLRFPFFPVLGMTLSDSTGRFLGPAPSARAGFRGGVFAARARGSRAAPVGGGLVIDQSGDSGIGDVVGTAASIGAGAAGVIGRAFFGGE